MNNQTNNKYYLATRLYVGIYMSALIVSFLYVYFTETFNGDFLGESVYLPPSLLVLNLIINAIPIIVIWLIYKHYKRKAIIDLKVKYVKNNVLFFIAFFLLVIHIFMAAVLGVGVLASEQYQMNSIFKVFVQIFFRFQPHVWVYLYILSSKNNRRIVFLFILFVLYSFSKHSLGGVMNILLVLMFRYYYIIEQIISKRKIFFLICLLVLPFAIRTLYGFRSELRGRESGDVEMMTTTDLFAGKLAGRLSCYSNTAYIMQNFVYFYTQSQKLERDYYFRQATQALTGIGSFKTRPEKILIKSTGYIGENVTFFTGMFGNAMMAFMKSPIWSFLNLLASFISILFAFNLYHRMHIAVTPELSVLMCLGTVVSGVANNFAYAVFFAFTTFFIYEVARRIVIRRL